VKILFLSGSLEPGKDGVGDYTRTLAAECLRLGHDTFLSSLNDQWIAGQRTEAAALRLGSKMPWPDRINALRAFATANRPEVVSLQFVPYSFHPAGLNFALPQILAAIIGLKTVHVMFHELWIGAHIGAQPNERLIGFCQRKIIQSVTRRLVCRTIHTSNLAYVQLLARVGIQSKLLPLFGSIPIAQTRSFKRRTDDDLRLGMFGSIHPEWSADEMLLRLRSLSRPIRLSHIGRIGRGEPIWTDLIKRFGSEIKFERLGEQPSAKISELFSSVDFGVTPTPLALIGKSASVAAMLDHGLPVIVNRNDVHFRGIIDTDPTSELLIPADDKFLDRIRTAKRLPPGSSLPGITEKFLSDLAGAQ
jgi:glycosyltransferase involved in cell wall biosynthesis